MGAELRDHRRPPPGLARVQADVQRTVDAGEVRLSESSPSATRFRRAGRGRVEVITFKPLSKNPGALQTLAASQRDPPDICVMPGVPWRRSSSFNSCPGVHVLISSSSVANAETALAGTPSTSVVGTSPGSRPIDPPRGSDPRHRSAAVSATGPRLATSGWPAGRVPCRRRAPPAPTARTSTTTCPSAARGRRLDRRDATTIHSRSDWAAAR